MTSPASGLSARLALARGELRLDVELVAPAPGITAVFGPSGAGKTTLLRAIAGLERAVGRVEVAGRLWQDSAAGLFLPVHRRPLGYVAQDAALFPHLTVRANLDYGRRRARGRRRLEPAAVVEWLGVGSLLDRRPAALSGGERQRVALARALLAGPELLLLDEPLAALDDEAKARILPDLERLHRELSLPVVYVSHARDEVLRLADRVVLLEGGRVRDAGPVTRIAPRLAAAAGAGDDPATVADATVAGHDEEFGLTRLAVPGGEILLPRLDAAPGEVRRLSFAARDVSLALTRPQATSILNVFAARVVEVREPGSPQPLVVLELVPEEGGAEPSAGAGTVLLSRITRRSLVRLGLAPGARVYAQVKAVALVR